MAGMRHEAVTAGFDIATMIVLLDDAHRLINAMGGERAQSWLLDHTDWLRREETRQACQDEPRERLDRPEREQEPTYLSCAEERRRAWQQARDATQQRVRDQRCHPPEKRTAHLGQAHHDVHQAWQHLGWAEGRRDVLHRHYGYPATQPDQQDGVARG